MVTQFTFTYTAYLQNSNIRHTLGNEIVDYSDVVGAAPAAPITSSFHTYTWLQWIGQRQMQQGEMRNIKV